MPDSERLIVSKQDGVKRITFHCPERRNALDRAASERFHELIMETAEDDTRVLVLTGTGDAFCAGADLTPNMAFQSQPEDVTEVLRRVVNPTIVAMREMPKPVIARVHGVAAGVGCNYALASDLRICSTTAKFGQAFSKIGLIPDGGSTYFLPHLIGYAKSFEMMVTGDLLDAQSALAMGLVNAVVEPDALDAMVAKWTERLLAGAQLAISGIKKSLHYGESHTLAESLECEAVTQKKCFDSEDFREGVAAFREKRRPQFRGR